MKRFLWILAYVILGISFWIPAIIIHGIRRYDFGHAGSDYILMSLTPIVVAVLTLEILARWRRASNRPAIALWLLLGIWIFGPLSIMTSATFVGGGFATFEAWSATAIATALFIAYVPIMSLYDGTAGALTVVTLWLLVVAIKGMMQRRRQT